MLQAKRIQAIIFDLGDTLIRTPISQYEDDHFYAETARQLRLARPDVALDAEQLRHHQGLVGQMIADSYYEEQPSARLEYDAATTMALAMRQVAPQYADDAALQRTIYDIGRGLIYSPAVVSPYTYAVLDDLRGRGYRLGLCSNYFGYADVVLDSTREIGIAGRLDACVFSCEVGWRKPNPRIYTAICAKLAVAPTNCLFVGDRLLEDIHSPQELGMQTVLSHEYRQEQPVASTPPPDLLIERLDQLLAALLAAAQYSTNTPTLSCWARARSLRMRASPLSVTESRTASR